MNSPRIGRSLKQRRAEFQPNALLPCSSQLKKAVGKKSLLTRSKLPIAPADLRRMVAAAGIGKKPAVPEQTA
jgi:hypothetical protein